MSVPVKKFKSRSHKYLISLVFVALFAAMTGCGSTGGVGSSSGSGGVVTGGGGGSVTTANLSWSAPTTRMNGYALAPEEIQSYTVHYGTTSGGPYAYSLYVPTSACTPRCSATVTGLGTGTYYFVVSATDTSSRVSGYSAEVSKTLL